MAVLSILIHESSNGDRWRLCRDDDPADVFVVHEPNEPFGGRQKRIDVTGFLVSAEGSPEHRALLAMIASLVEAAHIGKMERVLGPDAGVASTEPRPGENVVSI